MIEQSTGTALTGAPEKTITLGKFELRPRGLGLVGRPEYQEWLGMGEFLKLAEGAVHWWLGDWLRIGEDCFGERHAQAVEMTSFADQTLYNDVYVASRVPEGRRRARLPWSLHAEVASLAPAQQDYLLDCAERGSGELRPDGTARPWTQREMREAVRAFRQEQQLLQAAAPQGSDGAVQLGRAEDLLGGYRGLVDLILTSPPGDETGARGQRTGVGEKTVGLWPKGGAEADPRPPTPDPSVHNASGGAEQPVQGIYPSTCCHASSGCLPAWLTLAVAALKDRGSIMLVCRGEDTYRYGLALMRMGLYRVGEIVWQKIDRLGGGRPNRLAEVHETVLWYAKTAGYEYEVLSYDLSSYLTKSVWQIPERRVSGHPTEKPERLCEYLVQMATKPGQLVLDPWCGGGEVVAVAKRLKRLYGGVEENERWHGMTVARLDKTE